MLAPDHPLRRGLEIAVVLLIAFGLGKLLPAVDWMVVAVAIVAARFGFWHGALAGLAGTGLAIAEHAIAPGAFLSLTGPREALPGALAPLITGMAVGLVGDGHLTAIKRGKDALAELTERHETLARQHAVVVEAKEALDTRVVGQVQSFSSMYEAARELEVLDPQAILPATARLVARFLDAEAVAVYALSDFRLSLAAHHGDRPGRPEQLPIDDGPIGTVVRTGVSAGVRTKADFARAPVLMAAPIMRPDGQVRGLVAVEKLPFARLTPASQQMLDMVADWASRALATSEAYAESLERQSLHPETGLSRVEPLIDRLRHEWRIAARYRLPLSVVLVRQPEILDLPAAERPAAARPVADALRRLAREVDVLGHYRTDDAFLLLMPMTRPDEAETTVRRVEAALPGAIAVAASNDEPGLTPDTAMQWLQVMAYELQDA